ncbi:MAG: methyltransferase domain-containing protein [Bacteroidia bacterium]
MKIGKLVLPLINPFKWIKAGKWKRNQPKYERAKGDLELKLYSKLLNTDMLHYGYFDDPNTDPLYISIGDVERAQIRYAEKIAEEVTQKDSLVLDVGCGMGGLSNILVKSGFSVEALTPDINQKKHIDAKYPMVKCHHMKFEDFKERKQFGTIINSESIQYIDLKKAFGLVEELMEENGRWIITDYFRLHKKGKSKSGHTFDSFKKELANGPFEIEKEIDITPNCVPTLKLVNLYIERFVVPGADFGVAKMKIKLPKLFYMTQDIRDAISKKADKEFAAVDPEKFLNEKKYVLFVLKRKV